MTTCTAPALQPASSQCSRSEASIDYRSSPSLVRDTWHSAGPSECRTTRRAIDPVRAVSESSGSCYAGRRPPRSRPKLASHTAGRSARVETVGSERIEASSPATRAFGCVPRRGTSDRAASIRRGLASRRRERNRSQFAAQLGTRQRCAFGQTASQPDRHRALKRGRADPQPPTRRRPQHRATQLFDLANAFIELLAQETRR